MTIAYAYGPNPWPQSFWDARAAANFVCGGAGAGLVVAAALSGARGTALVVPLLAGLALVACGLAAVFAEIGRPLRAANVVRNPATSWMTREAIVAPLLFASGVAGAFGSLAFVATAAALALAFVYCQGRMVHAARGIPAWRAPQVPWLFVATGMAEGLGLWLALAAFLELRSARVAGWLGVAIIARYVIFRVYRRGLGRALAVAPARALDAAGRALLWGGTLAPLVLLAIAAAVRTQPWAPWLLLAAGLCAALFGAWLKATLVLRAGHTQGYTLPALPVRGTRA
jgi:phenylacetyl-CoA:acceptor oxidoreductase subunit 2